MIDLTPLDVRKKAADFKKIMRGYDPQEVEDFLGLAAERLEQLVKENVTLTERCERLAQQVATHEGRETAVQEALVMAQKIRAEVREQAQREAEQIKEQAEAEGKRFAVDAHRRLEESRRALADLERHRVRFLKSFRVFLEAEITGLDEEEGRIWSPASPAADGSASARTEPVALEPDGADPMPEDVDDDGNPGDANSWDSVLREIQSAGNDREELPPT